VKLRRAGVAALGIVLALAGCRAPGAPSSRGADAAAPSRVVLESPSGRVSAVTVEVARGEAQVARGLMFRERLGVDEGMLFVFPETAEHVFWMKNTLIPLDMIFITVDGHVAGVRKNATPMSTAEISVGTPSRYVLEVPGGWAERRGVAVGDRVEFVGVAEART
jgi:uncharacterized membrane protein (UPF0127 family)